MCVTVNLDGCDTLKCVCGCVGGAGGIFPSVDKRSVEENKEVKKTCFLCLSHLLITKNSLKSTIYKYRIFIRLVLKG